MIRLVAVAFSALLLTGCGGDDPQNTSSSSSNTSFANVKKDISQMRHHLKNNQKKFDDMHNNTTKLSQQLPKLNQQMQNQIMAQSEANKKSIKQLSNNSKTQFKHLQDEINAFGKDMASKGY